jgi:hypothetical protein
VGSASQAAAEITAAWTPQPGPQADAISAVWCPELLFGGAKYGGKSDYLLGDFLQDVQTYGKNWRGILYRQEQPQLDEIIARSHEIFPQTGGVYAIQAKTWKWANGATLRFRHLDSAKEISKYQGHSYTWIGFDELGNWHTDEAYRQCGIANLRWGRASVPTKRIRGSANPGGKGHHWVKDYFIDPHPLGYEAFADAKTGSLRMFIPSRITDNTIGVQRDPQYIDRLRGLGSEQLVKAWLEGDWSAVLGAYFTQFGIAHQIRPFVIPQWWPRFRAFDWGSAKPFCCLWIAVSDGTVAATGMDGTAFRIPPESLVVYREYYGASGPNKGLGLDAEIVADRIVQLSQGETYGYSVADPAIFTQDGGPSIAERMRLRGVSFRPADNSRLAGWDQVRSRLTGMDERPLLYIFGTAVNLIRTFPLAQHDPKKAEDVDTDGEDHPIDTLRYGVMSRPFSRPEPKKPQPISTKRPTLDELYADREREQRMYRRGH